MPRYIDADALRSRVKAATNPYGKPSIDYESGVKVLAMIDQQPTADVVPRSEVEKWYHEYHAIRDKLKQEKMYHRATEKLADRCCAELQTANSEVEQLQAEVDRLKKDNEYILMQHAFQRRPDGKCWNDVIEKAKSEVAREIFAEIYEDCFNQFGYIDYAALDKLKKKYTEGETNGNKAGTEI